MELTKTNKGLLAVAVIAGLALVAYNATFKPSENEKNLGKTCNNFGGAPDGITVFDFPLILKDGNVPDYYCKRCNETGCRQQKL